METLEQSEWTSWSLTPFETNYRHGTEACSSCELDLLTQIVTFHPLPAPPGSSAGGGICPSPYPPCLPRVLSHALLSFTGNVSSLQV